MDIITGQVSALSDALITLLSGPDTWYIKRTATTTVTNGTLAVGNTVTVQCLSTDAVKKGGGAEEGRAAVNDPVQKLLE